jgi:hypothetical protein
LADESAWLIAGAALKHAFQSSPPNKQGRRRSMTPVAALPCPDIEIG